MACALEPTVPLGPFSFIDKITLLYVIFIFLYLYFYKLENLP